METANMNLTEVDFLNDQVAIVQTLQHYIDGSRSGKSELMRPGFHPDSQLVGYVGNTLLFSPIQVLYDWIDQNGPAPDIEPDFASIEVLGTIAVVRLEIRQWSGKNAGSGVHMSDIFNLIKTEEGWKISQKLFHWHS
ncbi:nuclear transport factor 2 family protein [Flavitalea sp.]|nr:nuclear transport factor 2 family protein [Flavitalea sp.]